ARRVEIAGHIRFLDLFPIRTTIAHLAGCFGLIALFEYRGDRETWSVDICAKDSEGKTALWYACLHGHLNAVEWLLRRPEVRKAVLDDGAQGALFVAELKGHHDIVRALRQVCGSEVATGFMAGFGATPLFLASVQHHAKMVDKIMEEVPREMLLEDFELMRAYAAENSDEPAFEYTIMEVFRERFQLVV
ncbi:MAG: hypothetical protein M1824_002185, partial [Vezdaea acicularis]